MTLHRLAQIPEDRDDRLAPVDIRRLDAHTLDLDVADAMAAAQEASYAAAGTALPPPVGPGLLLQLRHGSSGRAVPGVLVAADGDEVLGWATVQLPWRDNTSSAHLHGYVHPDHRGRRIGTALHDAALDVARGAGRATAYAGSFDGTGGGDALLRWGYRTEGQGVFAIRRIDLHAAPAGSWDRVYDDAAAAARDYELVRLVGPAPEDALPGLVTLHAAINDAPPEHADQEAMVWDTDRVTAYDRAMAARHQTVHRVLARHRTTGAWAGMSMLCIDEFRPSIAFQEDTSVVREHRGHRLGLLMKADLHRWVADERPEVAATDTWNATDNHHMIAVNERLGARVLTHHRGARKDLARKDLA